MSEDLKKMNDEELWSRWRSRITEASRIKKELDRRQNAPHLRLIKNKNISRSLGR